MHDGKKLVNTKKLYFETTDFVRLCKILPGTRLHCETTDTGLVHRSVYQLRPEHGHPGIC